MRSVLLLCAVIIATPHGKAAEVVIDWESGARCAPERIHGGLRFTNARGSLCIYTIPGVSNGTQACFDASGLLVEHLNGAPFSLLSAELAENGDNREITFVGTREDGSQVLHSVQLDGVFDGAGGEPDFQVHHFPESFRDLVKLEVPTTEWACDNLRFDAVVPPPFPEHWHPVQDFLSARRISEARVLDNAFVAGPDYSFIGGFRGPDRIITLDPPTAYSGWSPWLDRESGAVYFAAMRGESTVMACVQDGIETTLFTLAEVIDAGYTATSLGMPRPTGDGILFAAFDFRGSDAYWLLRWDGQEFSPITGPGLTLPGPDGPEEPFVFPRELAVADDSFAFDTSVEGSPDTTRLFASINGGALRVIVSEGEQLSLPGEGADAQVDSFEAVRFVRGQAGAVTGLEVDLLLRQDASLGTFTLTWDLAGNLIRSEPWLLDGPAHPANVGRETGGFNIREPLGSYWRVEIRNTDVSYTTLFRRHGDQWFRIIGTGDRLDGGIVSYLEFLTVPPSDPPRVIVEVRFESSGAWAYHYELTLPEAPVARPPRLGAPSIHPESGDLFIPVDRLTTGRRYVVRKSASLERWTDLWEVPIIDEQVHVRIPRSLLDRRSFFRIEEEIAPE